MKVRDPESVNDSHHQEDNHPRIQNEPGQEISPDLLVNTYQSQGIADGREKGEDQEDGSKEDCVNILDVSIHAGHRECQTRHKVTNINHSEALKHSPSCQCHSARMFQTVDGHQVLVGSTHILHPEIGTDSTVTMCKTLSSGS